ncbi:non-specific serine/threonine protein kinase [Entamoeba marina]
MRSIASFEFRSDSPTTYTSVSFQKVDLQIDIDRNPPILVAVYYFTFQSPTTLTAHRYSDFLTLDSSLRRITPTLPPIPNKEHFKLGTEPKVIQKRVDGLLKYLRDVLDKPIGNSNVFLTFIRNGSCGVAPVRNDYSLRTPSPLPQTRRTVSLSTQEKCGYLFREGSVLRTWKKRYFILEKCVLVWLDTAKSLLTTGKTEGISVLTGGAVRSCPDRGPDALMIIDRSGQIIYIRIPDGREFSSWLSALQNATKANKRVSPNRKHGRLVPKRKKIVESDVKERLYNNLVKAVNQFHSEIESFALSKQHGEIDIFDELQQFTIEDATNYPKVLETFDKLVKISRDTMDSTALRAAYIFSDLFRTAQAYNSNGNLRTSFRGNNNNEPFAGAIPILLKQQIQRYDSSPNESSGPNLVCRLCENEYKRSEFMIHSQYCEIVYRLCEDATTCQERITSVNSLLKQCINTKVIRDTLKATQIVELTDCEESFDKLVAATEKIEMILKDVVDVCLLTFGRALLDLMKAKILVLNEFKEQQGKKSLWTSLSSVHQIKSTTVGLSDFDILKVFSAGAYSDLYAMKVMKKSDLIRKNVVDSVLIEKNILNLSHNKNVVKLYYAFQDTDNLYLVMEFCPGGDLAGLLTNIGRLDEHVAKIYAAEIILALEYIHMAKCVHRDLKPDNVLIDRRGHLLLTDFGLSTIGSLSNPSPSEKDTKQRVCCTPDYAAPESLLENNYSPASDYFALGCMIYEFVCGVPPFNAYTPEMIFYNIQKGVYNWPVDVELSEECKSCVSDELRKHPWFNSINWDTLLQENREDIFVPVLDDETDTDYFKMTER